MIELEELPEPIGNFIIEHIKGTPGADGQYYHYVEVCNLLKLHEKKVKEEIANLTKGKRTAEFYITNYKDPDGCADLANDLGLKQYDIFDCGEYIQGIEITVDEKLNIIGGKIIPHKPIKK